MKNDETLKDRIAPTGVESDNAPSTVEMRSPLAGWLSPLDEVPDAAFAGRMLGDGVAIDPVEGRVRAPCRGVVAAVAEARHAITIEAQNGAQILIHIGVDSVTLAGETFISHVKEGQAVEAGDLLITFDLDFVARHAKSVVTPVILVNGDLFEITAVGAADRLVGAHDFVMTVARLEQSAQGLGDPKATQTDKAERTLIAPIPHGLHARPAAQLAACARKFEAAMTVSTDTKTANAKSLAALMGLGVRHGARLVVAAEGADARGAVTAFCALFEAGAGDDIVPAPQVATASATTLKVARRAAAAPIRGEARLPGVAAAPGVVVGPIWKLVKKERVVAIDGAGPAAELRRLKEALGDVRRRISAKIEDGRAGAPGDAAAILGAHRDLLDDIELTKSAEALIGEGRSAEFAWRAIMREQAAIFEAMDDARLASRAGDFLDLENQVLAALMGDDAADTLNPPPGAIMVAEDLAPSDMETLKDAGIAGFCTAGGGPTSHVAIIAAAMNMPALVAIGSEVMGVENGVSAILDADSGYVHIAPEEASAAAVKRRIDTRARFREKALAGATRDCRTADGVRIEAFANLGAVAEAAAAVAAGAEGCGLLRTEFLFLNRDAPPSEDEQAAQYQAIASALEGRPLIIRTLDIGGDKPARYVDFSGEANPALGLRGVRTSLHYPALLDAQLRAILRVRSAGQCAVMAPMVSSVSEIIAVRARLDTLSSEMGRETPPPLGVMIETPASAVIADQIAEHADFLSIGTNDLTQYTLAMDRGHPLLAAQIDALHPAVLRLIERTARAGAERGRPVGVCGGLASDLLAAPILIGLGVTELSATPTRIAELKMIVRSLTMDECGRIAAEARALSSAAEIRALVRQRAPHIADWI